MALRLAFMHSLNRYVVRSLLKQRSSFPLLKAKAFTSRSGNSRRHTYWQSGKLIYPGAVLTVTGLFVSSQKEEKKKFDKDGELNIGSRKEELKTYTFDEVSEHNSEETRVWVTYKEGVYDVTDFVSKHPGGDFVMLAAGQAVDHYWKSYPIHFSLETLELLESMRIGNLDLKSVPKEEELPTEEKWMNEPHRNPALKKNQERPFNAEPPLVILTSQYYTPNDLFYIRNHLPVPARVDPKHYKLEVSKEGSKSINLSLEDLKTKFPEYTLSATIQCAGNRRSHMSSIKPVRGLSWGPAAIGNATWTGVRLCDVLRSLELSETDIAECNHVQFEGLDEDIATGSSYGASIPINTAIDPNSDVLLAYKMNGEELPMDHGYPLRVVVPGTVGARNVKWLSRIILSSEESNSLWQRRDYKLFPPNINISNVDYELSSAIQELPVQSVICSPLSGSDIKVADGKVNVKGYAWSGGGRGISRVEVSVDGGKSWQSAHLKSDANQKYRRVWAWTLWDIDITIPKDHKGKLDICCKAVDSGCNTQPERAESIWNFRGLANNSYHHVLVTVSE